MAKLIVIYWRDIPAQVVGKRGRASVKKELPEKFAKAIDRAAMRAGRGSSDAYLADWRRESVEVPGDDMEQTVAAEVDRLAALFPDDKLRATILNHGLLPKDTPDA
ncbi:MAG: virulence factor [Gammaproteobacteria bacterium]|nr:virulence factor [Gammaproteobacteria bacterium]